jgi:hypothetical protein
MEDLKCGHRVGKEFRVMRSEQRLYVHSIAGKRVETDPSQSGQLSVGPSRSEHFIDKRPGHIQIHAGRSDEINHSDLAEWSGVGKEFLKTVTGYPS